MTTETLQEDAGSECSLKTVVLYDDFGAGLKARQLLGRAADHAHWEGDVTNTFWRFDVMSEPRVARDALYRSMDADMVFLAAEHAEYPPEWLLEWLEIWASTRRIRDAALAAWCHGAKRGAVSEGIERLRNLAERHGLEWLCAEELSRKRTSVAVQ